MKLIIDELNEGERIDSYLAEVMPDVSRSKIKKGINGGEVFVNGRAVKPSYSLRIGDVIEVKEFITEPVKIEPEDILPDLPIWEDENMAVINKPSGMLTHPTTVETLGTLVNALLFKYGENLSDLNGEMRRGIVHRLDRNTSGLIMIAKNNKTHEFLVNEMKEHRFLKKYLAVVKGVVEQDEFEINLPIGRNPNQPHKMMTVNEFFPPHPNPRPLGGEGDEYFQSGEVEGEQADFDEATDKAHCTLRPFMGEGERSSDEGATIQTLSQKRQDGSFGKPSRTGVKVLERLDGATLVELTLYTGRTHQIRVHMSSIGHPVYNDTLYGFGKMKIKTEEQVLQSYKLEFTKPFTNERISLEIEPDEKIKKVLKFCKI